MRIEVLADADAVARKAAALIAAEARQAVAARGRFVMAVSGGHTPWVMLRALADEDVPWASVHIVQVDERVAPRGDADRNLTHLRASLLEHAPLPAAQIYAMPVEIPDLQSAAAKYDAELKSIAGTPPVLDLVHLGLGPDGHTDRKSTRLNSSHSQISYAVFCLKKKISEIHKRLVSASIMNNMSTVTRYFDVFSLTNLTRTPSHVQNA